MQNKRPTPEFRCPYCLEVTSQRDKIVNHMVDDHLEFIEESERGKMQTALRRLENLRKPGVRVVSHDRVHRHLVELKEMVDDAIFDLVVLCITRVLAEAMVIIGSEDTFLARRYKDVKQVFEEFLS